MLINDFFTLISSNIPKENSISAEIEINQNHRIFQGHFPANPVVPGVVSIQIIQEILSQHLGLQLQLSRARMIKFPNMINPQEYPKVSVQIDFTQDETAACKVTAQVFFKEIIFVKFKGIMQVADA